MKIHIEKHFQKTNLETHGSCGPTEAHTELHHRGLQRFTGKKLAEGKKQCDLLRVPFPAGVRHLEKTMLKNILKHQS